MPDAPGSEIDRNLVIGSVLFGAGWGMARLCPEPAVASITWGGSGGAVFLLAMIGGMILAPALRQRIDSAAAALNANRSEFGI